MEKRFATQLTHLFIQPYSPESKFDLVCRLACKAVEASSVSILMYDGRENKLHCKGRYIDPEVGEISIEDNPTLGHITRNICAYQYLYCSREKIKTEKPEILYQEYVEEVYPEKKAISKEGFIDLSNRINEWKNEYENLQRIFQNERYNIDSKTEWITGKWYRQLSEGKDYSPDILAKNLDEVDDEKKHFCMKYLEEELQLKFSAKYYAAFPLFAGGRYFGVLRFLFPGEKETLFKKQDKEWILLEKHKEKLLDIAQKVSLHLEIDYFLNGYKKTILTSQKHAHQKEPLDKFLNLQCTSLSEIIRSRGALIRHWNEDKDIYEIFGYSENIKEYIEKTKDEDQNFFKALSEKFQRERLLGVYFNCIEYPFKVTKFIYYEEKGRLKYERAVWEITELKESDILLTLIELELVNIAIFPIPGAEQYFIVFFNSENRAFLNKDIEMIYPALRNFGLALQAREYTKKIENRLNTINQMHREISKVLSEKDCKTHEYVIEFLKILSNTVEKLEIFPYHIQWEYVSEILPEEEGKQKKEQYMLRNITRKAFEDNPIKSKRNDYKELKLDSDEFSKKVLNYFKKGHLKPLFEFPSNEDFSYFDLPFFAKNDPGTPSLKLVGMLTLIYRREDENLVTTDEFFNFMEFFSNQLSLAWNQFQDRITVKIQEKIDYEIRFDKKEKIRTKKQELTLISRVLANEFKGDLCCFFLANEQEKTLKLETGSIPIERNIIYSLADEKPPLAVISYQTNQNLRIFGRKRIEELVDLEKLTLIEEAVKNKILESYKKDEDCRGILVEHWLSVVISIGEKKLGLIRLFRIKRTDNADDEKKFDYVTPPFSEFETNLLTRIQKHIFNIIFARQTIQQRMEDMRNVLHQVIAPLNALVGQSSNIAEGVVPKYLVPEKLTYMSVLAKIASKYARNFQKILELETGNIKLYKETLPDLRQYLIGLSIDYQALIKSKCIHIHVTPETPNNLGLEVDKDLFDHAISNLIDNAVKYSFYPEERHKIGLQGKPKSPGDKENVLITARETSNAVVITIGNWGIEMTGEEKKNVFKREFRGAKAIDRAPIGTGIGLFLAKEIIKLHNGQIELVPGTPKNNTAFKITLPKG